MDNEEIQELPATKAAAEQELEKMRTPVTILFSDIRGSTNYFEKQGDLEGMAMISRHNDILFPVIQREGGRIVKTIGDAIMASFDDPVAAIRAAAGMQRALEEDRRGRSEIEQIRVRIGLNTGLCVVKDGDIFGDVVNAASRLQHNAEPEQILITDLLLDAAKIAGFECARMDSAGLRGKDEPIDVYAVVWSQTVRQQLIEDLHAQYDAKLKELKRQQEQLEQEFENAREQWRTERRNLSIEIEDLEQDVEEARDTARQDATEDLQSELRFQVDEAVRARRQAEQDLVIAHQKFDAERNNFRAELATLQGSVIEAMERSNNPSRTAMAVREQLEARLTEAKQEWQLQWDGERKRLNMEIARLNKTGSAAEARKEVARRALLEKLGKIPAGSGGPGLKSAAQVDKEYSDAKIQWETERDELKLKVEKLELEVQRAQDALRSQVYQEMRGQYEPKIAEATRQRDRLEEEIQSLASELANERRRLTARIEQLEVSLPGAQEATRKQVAAELQLQFDAKLEETNRLRSRNERKQQDVMEEWETERRRTKKRIAELEEQLKEAKEAAYRAQKVKSKTL
jgi:class 3 adenylate cyclase